MTTIVGLKELRENMDIYITQVGKGKSFTVVRRSKPIFKVSPVDEWGDEGIWEPVVDFRSVAKKGISAHDVVRALDTLHAQNRKVSRRTR